MIQAPDKAAGHGLDICTRYAMALAVAIVVGFSFGPAEAGSATIQIGRDAHSGHQYRGVRKFHRSPHPGRFRHRRHGKPRIYHHRPEYHGRKHRNSAHGYRARDAHNCHDVSKRGHDRYGRRAWIGGTQCYDRRGYAYIVEGSRYVIRYY